MVALYKALQLILAISLLVLIHEAGHFMWARLFGIQVDKFFLFFDLGGTKLFSTRSKWFQRLVPSSREWKTEYGIGWLPLGGYCKIAGMIDESMDTGYLSHEPKPWEFRSKPAWQRLLVMSGGVLDNFLLAILIFSGILFFSGTNFIPANRPVYVNRLAKEMGFRDGDRILAYDSRVPKDFFSLQSDLARRQVRMATVLRGSDTLRLYIDQSYIESVLSTPGMFDLAVPFVVESVMEDSPNAGAGLEKGDVIVAVNGVPTPYLQDAQAVFRESPSQSVLVSVLREGKDSLVIPLQLDSAGKVGIYLAAPQYEHKDYSLLGAIPAGVSMAWENVTGYLQDLRLVATPSTGAYKSVGSFISIGSIFPAAWDWNRFFYIMAILSIMLGVVNLLPIPGLDGGHIVFCIYEMISGRKPSDKFLAIMQMIGMVFLILLMLLAFRNDIVRLFTNL